MYGRAKRQRSDLPAELLRSCYRSSLKLVAEKGGSIAFSCLSTGVYGYPSGEAAEVAATEVRRFLESENDAGKIERVIFCCFERKDVDAYEEWLPYVSFFYGMLLRNKARDTEGATAKSSPPHHPISPRQPWPQNPSL